MAESISSEMQQKGVVERTMQILSLSSITSRCVELTHLIQTTHTSELRRVFQILLEHIFGWDSYPGWRQRPTKRENLSVEADEVLRFLKADGPLIQLSYRLMTDPNIYYEFPVTALPIALQRKLAGGEAPAFLASKLQGRIYNTNIFSSSKNLILNPFEFFFFHYAHAELTQTSEVTGYGMTMGHIIECINANLLGDYLRYFVPITGDRKVPSPPHIPPLQREGPSYMLPSTPRQNNNLFLNELNTDRPTLFKASVFQDEGLGTEPRSSCRMNPSLESDCWRTEVILNILITMWLNIDEINNGYQFDVVLPGVELIKSIRAMVRHLHYFVNFVNETVDHPLEEVKRNVIPTFQKKLYLVLRYLFTRWPLDNSFRIVYETWLSYIQPWRYSNKETYRTQDPSGIDLPIVKLDGNQCTFVLENLLFYTYLFQQMLPRLTRVDFTSTRNAHMLYRVTKVYSSIENLKSVILEIERSILSEPSLHDSSLNSSHGESYSSALGTDTYSFTNGLFSTSFTDTSSLNISASRHSHYFVPTSLKLANAKQLMRELEHQDFKYVPLFSNVTRDKVSVLVDIIGQALVSSAEVRVIPKPVEVVGWFQNWTQSLFGKSAPDATEISQEVAQIELGKLHQFLNLSRNHLVKLFSLPTPVDTIYEVAATMSSSNTFSDSLDEWNAASENRLESSEIGYDSEIPVLSSGIFPKPWLTPTGNPDSAPPYSYEVPFFVSTFLSISRYLNQWVCPWAENVYFGNNLLSRICRATLAPPLHYYELKKFGPCNSIQEKKYLPPRVNLRSLATVNLPYKLMAIILLSLFFGFSGMKWVVVVFGIILSYILLRAFYEPTDFLCTMRQEFAEEIGTVYHGGKSK